MNKKPQRYFRLMIVLLGVYVSLTLINKPTEKVLSALHLTSTKALIITLSVDLFLGLIWLIAAYGFVQVLNYSQVIARTKEGKAFRKIAFGLGLLTFRQPITSIVNTFMNGMTINHPGYTSTTVIVINYIGVAVALAGFGLIGAGAQQLSNTTAKRPSQKAQYAFRLLALVLIACYAYLAIGRAGYQTPLTAGGKADFYLPSWLIVSTIIVPYAYAWYMAFVAAYQLRLYGKNVKGVVYKAALRWMAVGINLVIISTIVVQFITAQGSRLNKLNLGPLLVIVYLLLIMIGVGFVVIALGAKKLKRIEEV